MIMDKLQRQTNRENMILLLEQCEKSGKSIKSYCLEKNIPEWKYYYWKNRIEQERQKEQAGFVPITKKPQAKISDHIVIEYPSGTRLHIPSGMPANQIASLIRIA